MNKLQLIVPLILTLWVCIVVAENSILELDFPEGTSFRKGVPSDEPKELLSALINMFEGSPPVTSARLGLVEFLPPDEDGIFSYVIGISSSTSAEEMEIKAKNVGLSTPMGRWPAIIVNYKGNENLFTSDAIIFYSVGNK